jgi:hypothetical protein
MMGGAIGRLASARTLDSSRECLAPAIDQVRMARRRGELVGFAMLKDDEHERHFDTSSTFTA